MPAKVNLPVQHLAYAAGMNRAIDTRLYRSHAPYGVPTMADVLSARLKELLGRAIEDPETLNAGEVREMAASVMFCLSSQRAGRAAS